MRISTILWALGLGSEAYASLHAPFIEDHSASKRSGRGYAPNLAIVGATLTSKRIEGTKYTQIIEMTVTNNHDSNSLTLADTFKVTINSDSLDLVQAGNLTRLAPHQSAVVQVGVKNKSGVTAGSTCGVTVVGTYGQNYGKAITTTQAISGVCGIPSYSADTNSLGHHWTPEWYNGAKFGIFIHWGIYSGPAFGNTGTKEDYSEWYWCRMHDPNYRSQTYQYHQQTYGTNVDYDSFFSNFTADKYDPVEWVNLFAQAGARYIVPVMKHHDGFALYNTSPNLSKRSSVNYGPKRDLYGDLINAAKQYQPQIKRGTYFSMPEWYNPDYVKYRNPEDTWGWWLLRASERQPLHESSPLNDYVKDFQLPQMNELAYDYGTDLMWCDIGGPNNSTIFASDWFNWARDNGRQVTMNNRCGIPGDFETPEYYTNGNTPDSGYLTGNDIVQSLVDIVSKNGNFLLDIGPDNHGNIPVIMQKGLKDAGSWIHPHAESIYDTRYWATTPGSGNFRYTTKNDAFYIHYLVQPGSTLTISDPVPWLPGDTVSVLGGSQNGKTVSASKSGNDLVLQLDDDIINGDKYVWTFKIAYTSDY